MAKCNFVIIAILFISSGTLFSQTSKWENFTDYKTVTAIASDNQDNNIYCASSGGLFVVNSSGDVTKKYTNLNGLISNDLTSLTIDGSGRLWVGASDGSISILNVENFTWKYIFDIKNSSESDKSINYMYPIGNFMYVATGYGIQKISTSSFNFIDAPYYKLGTFVTNAPVYSLTSLNNVLYAATKYGVAYANYVSSNLNNPLSWNNYSNLPLSADVKTIETFDNKIFAGSPEGLAYFDGTNWLQYPNGTVANQNTIFIEAGAGKLYFISGNNVFFSDSTNLSVVTPFLNQDSYTTLNFHSTASKGNFLILGLSNNGIRIDGGNYIFPNSPFTNIFNQISIDASNNIWAAGGTTDAGFYKYDGVWENFNTQTHPEICSSNWYQKITNGNGIVWAMSFGGGVTKIEGNNITCFNTSNSILPGISNNPNFCVPYGGAYDNTGTFWVSFFASNSGKSLYAYSNNTWTGFINPSIIGVAILADVAVDSYNTKWIVCQGARSGIYFFNENGSLQNPDDDIYGFYDNSDFGSEVTNINDVIVERNNEVWVATNNGVFIISNPYGAIQNPNQKPPAQKLGIISGNLKVPFTENCITITNDILNNKWIGTETNGVFHLSSDGSTLLEQFNTSKSPILSNKVTTIEVSNVTGRAYFGTQKGLSSYQTDAIKPVAEFGEITASPNPYLLPSNSGMKIDGLIENSIIKIITLSGEIVSNFDSPGGRIAVWNGKNSNNEYVPTGIYIIVAYNQDGSKVGTGKVAVVRK